MPHKIRLDLLLAERGLVESRAKAQAVIMAGQVRVNGQMLDKVSAQVMDDVSVEIDSGPRFVSRGGEKLDGALEAFNLNVSGFACADVGASTGGFSDCLLQRGAVKIYTIDVGKGILHWKLRNDPRIVVMEETNARHVTSLPEPVDLVTIDASFISLKILLPVVKNWINRQECEDRKEKANENLSALSGLVSPLFGDRGSEKANGEVIALIKPQFEAGKKITAKGDGVIRDPEVHKAVLQDILSFAQNEGFGIRGLIKSPLLGPKGNAEFLVWLGIDERNTLPLETLISPLFAES